ncbi:hypothetical protein [Pedobacter sp. SYSU D00535]|uniref:hypothetical protein n=1 Tax=Pedobacter sp. SYSU D00535 TaxID=2810308 RepID=UPI001A9730B5|nr:hypothetical protein [Pedobacter sp. SYSU D00535]
MKKVTILGLVAGAAAATAILAYRRKDGTRVSDGLMSSARNLGGRLSQYGNQLKDRLLGNVHGPHGEAVYLDMYDRQFYEDETGKRVYLDND